MGPLPFVPLAIARRRRYMPALALPVGPRSPPSRDKFRGGKVRERQQEPHHEIGHPPRLSRD
jgi:hypothetical protein